MTCFNPPPALRPGGTRYGHRAGSATIALFQSAPGAEAGGTCRRRPRRNLGSFNPPPALRPGGTPVGDTALPRLRFQSAPGAEAGGTAAGDGGRDEVSFNPPPALRPGGTRSGCRHRRSPCCSFNPPPALRPGDTVPRTLRPHRRPSFNPPPAPRPGEHLGRHVRITLRSVSIRPRRRGRGERRPVDTPE